MVFIQTVCEIDLEGCRLLLFSWAKNHEDDQIRKAQLFMENNIGDKIIIEELSCHFQLAGETLTEGFR